LHCYAFVTQKLYPNSHCKRYAETSSDLQKDFGHAAFTEVQVQCDAAHRRLVEKLRMQKIALILDCRKPEKVLFSDESHFFFQGNSRFYRIRNREQLSSAHCNELVKEAKKMFWGSFSFSVVASLMPIEGMMNLYKYIDVIERKAIPDMRKAFPDSGRKFQ